MSHVMCRECHKLVSDEAKVCPHCGISRPGRTAHADGWLARNRAPVLMAVCLLGLELAWFRYQVDQLNGPPLPPESRVVAPFPRSPSPRHESPRPGVVPIQWTNVNVHVVDRTPGQPVPNLWVSRFARGPVVRWADSLGWVSFPWRPTEARELFLRCGPRFFIREPILGRVTFDSTGSHEVILAEAVDGAVCATVTPREAAAELSGVYSPGFEDGFFTPCASDSLPIAVPVWGDRQMATDARYLTDAGPLASLDSAPGDDKRYFVRWEGTLSGPAPAGHLGMGTFTFVPRRVIEGDWWSRRSCTL
jgi:hypothetical protein